MMTKETIERKFKEQLALELNCAPEDFSREEAVITCPVLPENRRHFSEKPFFLQMACFGAGTVISADERLHPLLREWTKGKQGFWLFEQHNYCELERALRPFGYRMALTHHMFTPKPAPAAVETSLTVRWLEQADIAPFYGRAEFPNAICSRFHPERPDVLAVLAVDGEEIMGMAGCSADTPELWQIGVDVLSPWRGRGIGKTLVSLLRSEALRRGAIPYYGTSLSNIRSWRVALAAGFLPAWVEAEARGPEDGSLAE